MGSGEGDPWRGYLRNHKSIPVDIEDINIDGPLAKKTKIDKRMYQNVVHAFHPLIFSFGSPPHFVGDVLMTVELCSG